MNEWEQIQRCEPYRPEPPRSITYPALMIFTQRQIDTLKKLADDEIAFEDGAEKRETLERLADELGFELTPKD